MERIQIPCKLTYKLFKLLICIFLLLPGCNNSKPGSTEINKQINVYGAELFSDNKFETINGISARQEPCTHGYENIYDKLNISIGYSRKEFIRKITTTNTKTSMFGIRHGESFSDGKIKILKAGFSPADSEFNYRKDWCIFTFLVNENRKIFGMRIEVAEKE